MAWHLIRGGSKSQLKDWKQIFFCYQNSRKLKKFQAPVKNVIPTYISPSFNKHLTFESRNYFNYRFGSIGALKYVTLFYYVDVLLNCAQTDSWSLASLWFAFYRYCYLVDVISDCTANCCIRRIKWNQSTLGWGWSGATHVCCVTNDGAVDGRGCGEIHISSTVVRFLDSTRPGVDWQRPIAT